MCVICNLIKLSEQGQLTTTVDRQYMAHGIPTITYYGTIEGTTSDVEMYLPDNDSK